MNLVEHLRQAREDFQTGVAAFKSGAEHMFAAKGMGANQEEIAEAVGISQSTVSRYLKWAAEGYPGHSPFEAENDRAQTARAKKAEELAAKKAEELLAAQKNKEQEELSVTDKRSDEEGADNNDDVDTEPTTNADADKDDGGDGIGPEMQGMLDDSKKLLRAKQKQDREKAKQEAKYQDYLRAREVFCGGETDWHDHVVNAIEAFRKVGDRLVEINLFDPVEWKRIRQVPSDLWRMAPREKVAGNGVDTDRSAEERKALFAEPENAEPQPSVPNAEPPKKKRGRPSKQKVITKPACIPTGSDRELLLEHLSGLCSQAPHEVSKAAEHAERLRARLDLGWDQLIADPVIAIHLGRFGSAATHEVLGAAKYVEEHRKAPWDDLLAGVAA